LRAPAARAAVVARAAPAGMRAVSPTAQLVVMRAPVALVAWAELLARRARTPHRWSAALAASAVTPELLVLALRVWAAWMEHPSHARAALAALAALAEREPIAAPVAPAAVALPGRAAVVVLVLRAPAARAAVVARAAPAGMRAVSPTAQLVVMRAPVALVAWAELQAHRARTLRPWSAGLAASVATPVSLVLARRVWAAWMEHPSHARAALAALAVPAEREPIAALAALVALGLPGRAVAAAWAWRAPAA